MPKVLPTLPEVQWPESEGAIGVVGVAPWATVDFLNQIYTQADAQKDWDFPRVLVDANSKIPSRGRFFDLNETDPSPFIADTIDELIEAGATAVVVPCNTAHILFDRWSARAADKIVNIIDVTVNAVSAVKDAHVAVLGSAHLVRYQTYTAPLMNRGLKVSQITQTQQNLIGEIITEIKVSNRLTKTTSIKLRDFFDTLQSDGITVIVLGCTELAQALRSVPKHGFTGTIVDSNYVLANAVLKRVLSV